LFTHSESFSSNCYLLTIEYNLSLRKNFSGEPAEFVPGYDGDRRKFCKLADECSKRRRMMRAPLPANEAARLEALRQYQILDTHDETAFDDLTRIAAYICQT